MQPSWDPSGVLGVGAPYDWRTQPPAPQVIVVSSPPVSKGWSYQAPQDKLLQLVTVSAKLVTSAGVFNRIPRLQVAGPGGQLLLNTAPYTGVGASSSVVCCFAAYGVANMISDGYYQIGAPLPATFPPACVVSTGAGGITTGDQWSTVTLLAHLI